MREIKFRAWDKNGTFNQNIPCMHEDITGNTIFDYIWHNDDFPKMQYTGLKDKNGKGIYESDVLKITSKFELRKSVDTGEVKWNDDLLSFECVDWLISELIVNVTINKQEIEIIGNIYENPELIK